MRKKTLYQKSSVVLNQEIGNKPNWTLEDIKNHEKLLIDAALKIFRP